MTAEERKRQYTREWKRRNPEKVKAQKKKHREKHKDEIKAYMKKYYAENKEKMLVYTRKYYQENPQRTGEYSKRYYQRKRKNNPHHTVSAAISRGIYKSLKADKCGRHWETLVNYTVADLRRHLESRFVNGMNWTNYGEWHIDHIIPVSWWKFEACDDPEFKQCWALCNLQPLWAEENIAKSNLFAG